MAVTEPEVYDPTKNKGTAPKIELGTPTWSWAQYYAPYEFDEDPIFKGKDGFESEFYYMNKGYYYTYGFFFVKFLTATYGEDILKDIGKAAADDKYDARYDPENEEKTLKADDEHMKKIIISVTEKDVFEKFAEWYKGNKVKLLEEWKTYMTSIGENVYGITIEN